MTTELTYSQLTPEQRAQVAARFRDDLFGVESSEYFYQFEPGGLYRRPITLTPRKASRAKRNPPLVIIETGKPVITPALMDILVRAYFTHQQGVTQP